MRIARCLAILMFAGLASIAEAATKLYLCATIPCPAPVPTLPPPTVTAGATFLLVVTASDGFSVDQGYTGTVQFASSDPLAVLPATYTFVAADQGTKSFTAVLRTGGTQTITVTDATGGITPGNLALVVTGAQAAAGVPALSPTSKLLVAVAVAAIGFFTIRRGG